MNELAIACNLSPEELERRGADLLPGLLEIAAEREPVENGYTLRYDGAGDQAKTLLSMVGAERECCPFFRFEIVVEPGEGPVSLTLTGPSGTREFIEMFIAGRT